MSQPPCSVTRPSIQIDQCWCHVPLKTIQGKKDGVSYIVCGVTNAMMKEEQRPCTLFCKEKDWPVLCATMQKQYPNGMDFQEDFPACHHVLKCRVGINKKGTLGYYSCRLSMQDPDAPCEYFEAIPLSDNEKREKKRSFEDMERQRQKIQEKMKKSE